MATQAVAVRQDTSNNPVAFFKAQLESRARDIQSALPAHISTDKFQRTIMTAVAQNPELLKADRNSLILSCYKAAQDALLPDGREAALVTFNTRQKVDGQWQTIKQVQYMPMVYGLRKKILQSGDVIALEVNVVYRAEVEKGTFLYEIGLEPPLRHRPSLDLTEEETADDQIVAAYSIATMKDGTKSFEIMRRFEINKVREASQTGATRDRNGQQREAKGPWVDWFAEMAKKTVMRRHAKTLPMSGDVLLDVEGRDLENGMSAARALGSVAPESPQLEDRSEETPHDPETGEIIEDESAEGNAGASGDTAQSSAEDTPTESGTTTSGNGQTATTDASPSETDEMGVTKHPAEGRADQLIGAFKKAETVIDLNNQHKAAEEDIAAMPEEIAAAVESAYSEAVKRLKKAA
jgi:recombination protein RecT